MGRTRSDQAWDAAFDHVLDDPDGAALRTSQALWALAVRAEYHDAGDVQCAGDAFGPVLAPGGFVVMRPQVAVRSADPRRTLVACDAAWRRWFLVGDDGVETDEEWLPGDPDPVGLPAVVDGVVLLGFDGREDDEPYPHRARTCLRILVEELRRHACGPVEVVNAVHVPDDDGVDVDELANRLTAPVPTATASPPAADGRPAWLPAFHRVERSGAGSPSAPVPFVLLAASWMWAWDPDKGLLKVPDLAHEEPAHVHFPAETLSPDGTRVRYLRYPGPAPTSPPPGFVHYDLASGAAELAEGPATWTFEAGREGARLYAYPPRPDADEVMVARYDVAATHGGPVRTLPIRDPLTSNHDGAAAQFSPDGTRLLTSQLRIGEHGSYVAVTDLRTGQHRVYEDVEIVGSVSWSPDGTRCLVGRSSACFVLDLESGDTTPIPVWPIGSQRGPGVGPVRPLAWLGPEGFLVVQRHGRRIQLAYQPLDGSDRYPVLDIPVPGKAGDYLGVLVAADVAHQAPWRVGRRDGADGGSLT